MTAIKNCHGTGWVLVLALSFAPCAGALTEQEAVQQGLAEPDLQSRKAAQLTEAEAAVQAAGHWDNPVIEYNREDLDWQTDSWTLPKDFPGEYTMFYRDLYQTIRHGADLFVTPASVRRQIALLERCRLACGA